MTTRRFTARNAELGAVSEFIETECASVSHDARVRVMLVVEELFANSVMHGYGADSDKPVWLTLEVGGDACRVVYEDEAPPYDPFSQPDNARLDAPVEERPVGGLGIIFLTEFSGSHRYARRGGRNVIEFDVPLGDRGTDFAP